MLVKRELNEMILHGMKMKKEKRRHCPRRKKIQSP
jgi:hypothetical protein